MANTTEPSMCGGDAAYCHYCDHLFVVAHSALSSLQCSNPVGAVKGRASGLKKMSNYSQSMETMGNQLNHVQ